MKGKITSLVLAAGVIVGYGATIVVNALANILPINNYQTGQLSDMYPNLFVPAGLTFAVWGVIYLLLAAFSVYQLVVLLRHGRSEVPDSVRLWFILSSVANIGWIFSWHYRLVALSLVCMLAILSSLIVIYLKAGIGRGGASRNTKIFLHLPFSVYLGWISIATIANVTAVLVDLRWDAFGISQEIWTILMIGAGLVLAGLFLVRNRDYAYNLVIAWAFLGIFLKRTDSALEPALSVAIAAAAGCFLILTGVLLRLITAGRALKGKKD